MEIKDNYEGPKLQPLKRFKDGWGRREYRWKYPPKPIWRFLQAHVGRQWDEVYKELCATFTKEEDRYWLDHRWMYWVENNCYEKDGEWYDCHDKVIYSSYHKEFFIVDGILRKKNPRSKYRRRSIEQCRLDKGIFHKDGNIYGKIEGIWYLLEMGEYKRGRFNQYHIVPFINFPYDAFLKTRSAKDETRKFLYGNANIYCKNKHQLNSKELKELGLKNEYSIS